MAGKTPCTDRGSSPRSRRPANCGDLPAASGVRDSARHRVCFRRFPLAARNLAGLSPQHPDYPVDALLPTQADTLFLTVECRMTDPDPARPDEKGQARKALGSYAQAGVYIGSGFQFAAAISAGLFAGWWLDGRLGTSPLLLIAGCLAGAVSGFWYLVRSLGGDDGEKGGSGRGGSSP